MSDVISFNTDELAKVKPSKTANIVTYNLVDENDPILYEPIKEWDFTDPNFGVNQANEFASSLVETCIKNRGLGLSANQCGFPYRVFVPLIFQAPADAFTQDFCSTRASWR